MAVDRYDWLLLLHVLAGFAIVAAVVVFTLLLLGLRRPASGATLRLTPLARRLWDVGGGGTLVLGVWLALDVDGYGLGDGWIVGALVLWVVAAAAGIRLGGDLHAARDAGGATALRGGRIAALYAVTALATLALVVLMVYKPGA